MQADIEWLWPLDGEGLVRDVDRNATQLLTDLSKGAGLRDHPEIGLLGQSQREEFPKQGLAVDQQQTNRTIAHAILSSRARSTSIQSRMR